jgi:hypothetical protein
MSDSFSVLVQRAFWVFRKLTEVSSLNISTEDGSRGASPPLGEAMVKETLLWRTWWGWANSGFVVLVLQVLGIEKLEGDVVGVRGSFVGSTPLKR